MLFLNGLFAVLLLLPFGQASLSSWRFDVDDSNMSTERFQELLRAVFRTRTSEEGPEWSLALPDDIWAEEILPKALDGPRTLLTLLQVCKDFNSIIRSRPGTLIELAVPTFSQLAELIWHSELSLFPFMLGLLVPRIICVTGAMKHDMPSTRVKFYQLRSEIFERSQDLELIRHVFAPRIRNDDLHVQLITGCQEAMNNAVSSGFKVIYCPHPGQKRLFETAGAKLAVVLACCPHYSRFSGFFVPSLLADYIIPGYKGLLSEDEKVALRIILKDSSSHFFPYLRHLFWACRFELNFDGEGGSLPVIIEYLQHDLGMSLGGLIHEFASTNSHPNLDAALTVAQQWGIAHDSLLYGGSMSRSYGTVSAESIIRIMYGEDVVFTRWDPNAPEPKRPKAKATRPSLSLLDLSRPLAVSTNSPLFSRGYKRASEANAINNTKRRRLFHDDAKKEEEKEEKVQVMVQAVEEPVEPPTFEITQIPTGLDAISFMDVSVPSELEHSDEVLSETVYSDEDKENPSTSNEGDTNSCEENRKEPNSFR